jgi:uncharacterized protein (DUF3084 family)
MREKLEQRLEALKAEFLSGKKMLADLEAQQENLKTTLLRISGAIQVLEELLAEVESENKDSQSPESQPIPLHEES